MRRRHLNRLAPALALAFALLGLAAGTPVAWSAPPVVGKLTWLGQSCFLLETAAGTRIVMDPLGKAPGVELPTGLRADLVTISHEHPDHNNLALIGGKPRVLRGLTTDRKGWTRIDEKFRDVAVRTVGVYHDEKRGTERGLNTVFVFEVGGMRIAHFGDLGHPLNDEQLAAVGSVDVVLVPVGGTTTIDARIATRIVDQLRPRLLVVPMHYKADGANKDLEPVANFLEGKPNVRKGPPARTITLSPVKAGLAAEIVVMAR